MKNTTPKPQPLDWTDGKASWKESGFDIVARIEPDDDPDFSTLGEYVDKQEPGVVVVDRGIYIKDWPEEDELPERGRECRFFKPYAGGEKVGTKEYREYGMQDFKRCESYNRNEWAYVGIVVKAYKKGVELGSASCWGFESDCQDYLNEETRTIADEAISEAKRTLAELCKS